MIKKQTYCNGWFSLWQSGFRRIVPVYQGKIEKAQPIAALFVAERAGFEPAIPSGIHAFQACALSLYATSPNGMGIIVRDGRFASQIFLWQPGERIVIVAIVAHKEVQVRKGGRPGLAD